MQVGRVLSAAALLLTAGIGLLLFTAVFCAAARGPVRLEAAGIEDALPAHAVEVEVTAAGYNIAATGEALAEFSARLSELAAAGLPAPAAVLRVKKAATVSALREALGDLKSAGFTNIYIAIEEEP